MVLCIAIKLARMLSHSVSSWRKMLVFLVCILDIEGVAIVHKDIFFAVIVEIYLCGVAVFDAVDMLSRDDGIYHALFVTTVGLYKYSMCICGDICAIVATCFFVVSTVCTYGPCLGEHWFVAICEECSIDFFFGGFEIFFGLGVGRLRHI